MNNPLPRYRAAIIGLGAIAHGYGSPEDASPYCHAGGLLHCGRFEFAAAADPFFAAREGFREKWGTSFPGIALFEDSQCLLTSERFDVVAVCVRGVRSRAAPLRGDETGPQRATTRGFPGKTADV